MTEAEMASDWAGDHPIISDAALKALSLKCPGGNLGTTCSRAIHQ